MGSLQLWQLPSRQIFASAFSSVFVSVFVSVLVSVFVAASASVFVSEFESVVALQCAVCSFGNRGCGQKAAAWLRQAAASHLLLACNAVVPLCQPAHSAMPGPSTAKQAAAAPLFVKSHRADWPLPPARDPTQPAESRAVQTLERSQPRRRGSPRGGRSGQKLSGGSWGSPSGGGRTETPRKNSSGPHSSGTAGPPRLPSLLHRAAAQPRPNFRAK